MKFDTSSYYPKSALDDDPELNEALDALPEEVSREIAVEEKESGKVPEKEPEKEHRPQPLVESEGEQPPTEAESIVTATAHFLSWVLVPLLMPVYGIMLAFDLSILVFTSFGTKLAFTAIVAGFNVLVPALVVMLLKHLGVVHDVGLNNRKERFLPYLVSILCLVGTALFLNFKGAPLWLVMFFFGGAAAGIVEVIVNNWWKISVHAAGMAGIVALLMHLAFADYHHPSAEIWLLIAIGLTGLLGAARIWLGRHTLGQVLAGYAVGFCAVYFLMMVN